MVLEDDEVLLEPEELWLDVLFDELVWFDELVLL